MNVPDELVETDWAEVGCSKRSCRYEHSHEWGLCAHAEEPPPDTRCFRWKTVTASDGYLSVVTEEVDHTELRAEIEREVRAKVAEEIAAYRCEFGDCNTCPCRKELAEIAGGES